jgi:hypothetical protein
MLVTKCDICRKKIGSGNTTYVRTGKFLESFEFCESCGKPITKFLIDKKLVDNKTSKKQKKLK